MTRHVILIFIGISFLASILRFWNITQFPPGFYSDEALYAYEAYSLLNTSKDQFGNLWPLTIAGFGDYRPALYIYATIPFIVLFDLTVFATRFPSALFSVFTVILAFFFVHSVTKNVKTGLFGMLMMAISPWSIYFGRMAHETNLMTLIILSGIYILYKDKSSTMNTFIKMTCFGLSFYIYHTARVFVPLFLVWTILLFWNDVKLNIKQFFLGMIILCFISMPLIIELKNPETLSRVSSIGIWNDPGIIAGINESRRIASLEGQSDLIAKLMHNKLIVLPSVFVNNFLSHFSPFFLLFKGDSNGVYNTPNTGILLWIEPIFILLGVWGLWRRNRRIFFWIFGALIFTLIPDSLTRVAPSSARIHLGLPFVALFSGVGLYELNLKSRRIFLFMLVPLLVSFMWFGYNYTKVLPVKNFRAWQIGTKEMILKANKLSSNYEKIWISREGWGWIHLVFHTKYDPFTLQNEIKHSQKNDLGFWWVNSIGNYYLETFPESYSFNEKNTLYIGAPHEFPSWVERIGEVRHPVTNQELYWLVSNK